MPRYLHTMLRITDPARSRAFYEALGFRFSSEMEIVREGALEATNYFFSLAEQEDVLELTYNHDGRSYAFCFAGSASAVNDVPRERRRRLGINLPLVQPARRPRRCSGGRCSDEVGGRCHDAV
jgi:catechol 2,3-dioxygenase-like lactoylglutathione lyase family enzyme